MDAFLYNLARHFYNHERGNLSQIAFVFPNRRSGKFFQKYLSQVADGKSLFSPSVITINTLLTELSQLQPVDKIELLFVLFFVLSLELFFEDCELAFFVLFLQSW